jgi:predicted dehydrogenase
VSSLNGLNILMPGDIGTHAENLGRYITDLQIEEICAEFTSFVKGRQLEDDANLLIRYKGGAKGVLCASQISVGEENDLSIRVYGTKGSLEWHQEGPNDLIVKYSDKPSRTLKHAKGSRRLVCPPKTPTSPVPCPHQASFMWA